MSQLVPFTFWSPSRTERYLGKECQTYEELVAAEAASGSVCSSVVLCQDEAHAASIAKACYNETDFDLSYHRSA